MAVLPARETDNSIHEIFNRDVDQYAVVRLRERLSTVGCRLPAALVNQLC